MTINTIPQSIKSKLERILAWNLGPYRGDPKDDKSITYAWQNIPEKISQIYYGFDFSQKVKLQDFIQEVLELEMVPRHSREFVERAVYELLADISRIPQKRRRIPKGTELLVNLSKSVEKWRILVIIPKLQLDLSDYTLGRLKFLKTTSQNLLQEMPL